MATMQHEYLRTHAPRKRNRILAWMFPRGNWRIRYAVLVVGLWVAILAWAVIVVARAMVM